MEGLDWTCTGWVLFKAVYCSENRKVTDFLYLNVNAAWYELTGERDNPIGKTIFEVFPGTEDRWIMSMAEVVQSGFARRFTLEHAATAKWWDCLCVRTRPNECGLFFKELAVSNHANGRQQLNCQACGLVCVDKSDAFIANLVKILTAR